MTFTQLFSPGQLADITQGRWHDEVPTHGPGCIGHDARVDLSGGLYVAIPGQRFDGHDFLQQAGEHGATMAMVERHVKYRMPQLIVADTTAAIAALAASWRDRLTDVCVIGVTGTAGKTSTKDLLHTVLSQQLRGSASPASWNNAIGGPMSLMRARPGDDYVVLELGTSSPGEIDALARVLQPDIGIVTLIGQGHLEGLGTLEGVAREKYAMLAHLPRGGLAIVHQNDHPISLPQGVRLIRHGDQPTCDVQLLGRRTGRIDLGDGRLFPEPFSGRHHAINALAVIAVAQHLGLSDATIAEGFSRATLSASRGREITHRGICFIDDSYNANPESVAASLAAFAERSTQGRRIVILGDMLELGSAQDRLHRALCEPILELHRRTPLNALVLVGPAMRALARQLEDECLPLSHHLGGPDSVRALADTLSRGDLVLLKGSRGVALERIIDHVRTRESEATAT